MTMWDWDSLKTAKTAAREYVDIVIDREWGRRLGLAQERLAMLMAQVRMGRVVDPTLTPEIERLTAEVEELNQEKDAKVCRFVFKSMAPDRYERLVAAHPPTKDQRLQAERDGRRITFNVDTFPKSLVKATLVTPKLTGEQVDEMWNPGDPELDDDDPDQPAGVRWTSAELRDLFLTAERAQVQRPVVQ